MEKYMDDEDSRVAALSHQSAKRALPDADLASEAPADTDVVHQSKRARRKLKKTAAGPTLQTSIPETDSNMTDNGRLTVPITLIALHSRCAFFHFMFLFIL
jgi:hypothetical protein